MYHFSLDLAPALGLTFLGMWAPRDVDEAFLVLTELVTRLYSLVPTMILYQPTRPTIAIFYGGTPVRWVVEVVSGLSVGTDTCSKDEDVLEAFVRAFGTFLGVGYNPLRTLRLVDEEIRGPTGPNGLWGLLRGSAVNTRGPSEQVPITSALAVAGRFAMVEPTPVKKRTCQQAEDHFFATALGGGRCFVCDKTAEEVYNRK